MKQCHACGAEWTAQKKQPGFKEFCDSCSGYLHCCMNCKHHNPGLHNECAISTTDWVGDRESTNFCDDFEFKDSTSSDGGTEQQGARDKLDALFGDSEEASDEDNLDKFKKLF